MRALRKALLMTPASWYNWEAIWREREVPIVIKESLTKRAIVYIFEHSPAKSSEMKKEFELSYSPYGLIKDYIKKGFISNTLIKNKDSRGRDSIYSIKEGLTLADFGL